MKNLILFPICFFLFQIQKTEAQVVLDPYQYPGQQISIPAGDVTFAEYIAVLLEHGDYLLIDTCDMYFTQGPSSHFTSQSLRRIRLLVDGEVRLTEWMLPFGEYWQFYPMEYLGFPTEDKDTALFTFVADVPDTTSAVPYAGDYLVTTLCCRYHFASNTSQSFETNTSSSQLISVLSSPASVRELSLKNIPVLAGGGSIFVREPGVMLFDVCGREISTYVEGLIFVSPGFYYWKQGTKGEGIMVR